MYKILKTDGRAKRAEFTTVHGTVQTPVFMNVGTVAAIKGAVATTDLQQIGTQIELSNTYHLHVRPGDKIIKQLGGLHKFMNWNKPILTDSGGFQDSGRLKKKALLSSHILTDIRYSWDQRKACRYSLILVQQSQWHLTNVHRQRLTESISRILLTEHTAG